MVTLAEVTESVLVVALVGRDDRVCKHLVKLFQDIIGPLPTIIEFLLENQIHFQIFIY